MISNHCAAATSTIACLRSNVASIIAAPNRAFNRCTSSLSSGKGFGAASFAGGAGLARQAHRQRQAKQQEHPVLPPMERQPQAQRQAAKLVLLHPQAFGIPRVCSIRRFRRCCSRRRSRFRRLNSLRRRRRSRLARLRRTAAAFRPARWRSYRIFLLGIVSHLSFGFRPPESTQQRQAARFRKPSSQSILQFPIRPRTRSNSPSGPHSQSNAPFRNSHTYPTIKIPRNTSIVNNPYVPKKL